MKNKRGPKPLKKAKLANPFTIPNAQWPEQKEILETVSLVMTAKPAPARQNRADAQEIDAHAKALASIATNAWKARCKMVDDQSGEPREEMKRVYRHIEGIFDTFRELGLEVKDHTGDVFDYGLPLKVVTTQPTAGITKERVTETIKPTVYWQNRIIQMGEVVIATPA